jgi:hypothetical protein
VVTTNSTKEVSAALTRLRGKVVAAGAEVCALPGNVVNATAVTRVDLLTTLMPQVAAAVVAASVAAAVAAVVASAEAAPVVYALHGNVVSVTVGTAAGSVTPKEGIPAHPQLAVVATGALAAAAAAAAAAVDLAEFALRGNVVNAIVATAADSVMQKVVLHPEGVAAVAPVEFASASNAVTANTVTVAALATMQPNKCIQLMPRGIINAVSALFIGICRILF